MTRSLKIAGLVCLGAVVVAPALADRLPLPPDTPAAYRTECGSCHLAFPPALLAAPDWQRIVTGLEKHFGTDAGLEPMAKDEIDRFLKRYAGDAGKLGGAGNPPRITAGTRFVRQHREVPQGLWRDSRVKSAANCEACHRGAASGRYSEHDLVLPELNQRERNER